MTRTLSQLGSALGLIAIATGLSAAAFITPFAALSQTAPKGWVRVKTEPNNKVWFVDAGSIKGQGRFRYFWSYITGGSPYPDPEVPGQLVHSSSFYLSVDCQQRAYRLRFAQLYDQNTKLLKEFDYGESRPLGKVTPGSGEEASLNFVCSRRR
jgi:hypothetical protein